MSRAYGWNAKLLIAEESTYGTLSSGPYTQVPFASSAIDSEQGLISSNVLGLGRDPTTPFQDVINVEGDLAVPVDLRNIGIWLKAVFGVPETTNENGVYTHTFESGKTTLPSYSLELGLAEVPEFIRFLGARANSIAFNFARSGEAQATVSLMAQSETASETSVSDVPEVKNYTRFSQFQGFIKSGGETLANVTSASVTYSNNLEKIETIRSDGKVEAIDLGVASLSGSIAVRYGDNALMDKARAGIPVDLELGYQLSDTQRLVITCHEVYLPKPKRSISGPGGIECSYDFQGAKNAELGKMVKEQLKDRPTATLIQEGSLSSTLNLPKSLALRYFISYASLSDFDTVIKRLRAEEDKYLNKLCAVVYTVCLNKNHMVSCHAT